MTPILVWLPGPQRGGPGSGDDGTLLCPGGMALSQLYGTPRLEGEDDDGDDDNDDDDDDEDDEDDDCRIPPLYPHQVIQSKSVFTRVTDGQRCCYYSMSATYFPP